METEGEVIEGGDKLGWFQDYGSFVSGIGKFVPGASSLSKLYKPEFENNALDSARIQSFLTGIPFLGGVLRGIDQARYAEDYYKNTGMVPKYPSMAPGYSGLSSGIGNAVLGASSLGRGSGGYNVKEGTNDLLTFYNYAYA